MMRKIYILLVGIIFSYNFLVGQVTISMSSVTVNSGQQAMVDITVNGWTNILVAQFSINYDSLVLQYGNSTNFSNSLPGLSAANVSGPNNVAVKNGQMTFSWSDPDGTGKTLPNGTRLFTIVFNAIGANGTSSEIFTSGSPRAIEIVNSNFMELNLINNRGTVTIGGSGPPPSTCVDPTCNTPNSLTLIGATVNAQQGERVCVPITVRNFNMMQSGQGSITWDATILRYVESNFPTTGGIPGFSTSFNFANAGNGNARYVWGNETPGSPLTLPNNTQVVELCFDVLASTGQGCVRFSDMPLATFWDDVNGEIPVCYTFGKVNIGDDNNDDRVQILMGNGSGNQGQIVCVDITVRNFEDIFSIENRYSWNPNQLRFVRTEMYGLTGLNASAFSTLPVGSGNPNQLAISWNHPDRETRPDGHRIYSICFELLCPDNNNYTAQISVTGTSEVTALVNNQPASVPANITGGNISVNCGAPPDMCTLTLGQITHASCRGAADGRAVMTVTNAGADCVYQWRRGNTIVQTGLVSSGTNLMNVTAGTYDFEVLCSGVRRCIQTGIVINEPAAITIPIAGVVTNAGCGGGGSINISATTGGNGGFTYAWTPDQGNTPNPTDLEEGIYTVTVTDSRGCTAQASFTVAKSIAPLALATVKTDVRCNGENNGTARVTVSGGCPPHTFMWSIAGVTGPMAENLEVGTYTVTVSDASTPANTQMISITINQPMPLSVGTPAVTNAMTPTSNDGRITITPAGGTAPYMTVWTGPTTISNNTTNAMNLMPGTYSVIVTDANGCTAQTTGITVGSGTAPMQAPEVGMITVTSNFNGSQIRCNGESNGVISGTIARGTYPIEVTLRRGNQSLNTITVTGPNFMFSNLPAGDYMVELKNTTGSVTRAITITQPRRLGGVATTSCSNRNEESGSISINMNNTGTAPYDFNWSGIPNNSNRIDNLSEGFYNVTISDANDCQQIISNIEIKSCNIDGACYTGLDIITPNGDNFNDVFVINCVEDFPSDLTIFDRWGRQVYTQINYDNTWKGEDQTMKDLREGAYIWVLTINFGQRRTEVYRNTITLLKQ